MPVAGKLESQRAGAAPVAAGQHNSTGRLLYLVNEADNSKLLVDSGAAFSVLPFS
jgi:hypothetical protein